MVLGGKLPFDGFRQVGQEKAALAAVSFRALFGFSTSWTKHTIQTIIAEKSFS
jgi:hypothetical protein